MKLLFVLALIGLAVARPEGFFNDPAFNEAVSNKRSFGGYLDCLSAVGPCTSEGKKFKETLPDTIKTGCASCTEEEKKHAGKAMVVCVTDFKEKCDALKKKYDPENKKAAELEQFIKKYGY